MKIAEFLQIQQKYLNQMANQKSQNLLKKQNCQDDNKQEQQLKETNLSREKFTQMQNSTNTNQQALNDEIGQIEKDIFNTNTIKMNNTIIQRKNEPFFIEEKCFVSQDIPPSQLNTSNLFLQKTLQQFQKCNNSFKVQPLQLTNVDAKSVIPKQPKKIQLDNRNKSIAYLQNIFHKNYLKQQGLIDQSNLEGLNTQTKRQKLHNNNVGNYTNLVHSKETRLSSNIGSNLKENSNLLTESIDIQNQNNYSELLLQFLKEENENMNVNQAIRFNSMQQDSTNNQNKIHFFNKKNMNEEYFSGNYHPEIQHLKYEENAVLSERQTNQINYNKESSILIKNLKNQIKHSSNFLQEMIKQKYEDQNTQNQEKYDSTKFENELRQKHKLTLINQTQANQKKLKNLNLDEYNSLFDKIQQIQKYKQVNSTKSSKTLTEFPFKIQQSLDCLEQNKLSSWEEDQKLEKMYKIVDKNINLEQSKHVFTNKKGIRQKQLSFTENILNQKIHKHLKTSLVNEQQISLKPLNRKLNYSNNPSQLQRQLTDSLFIDQAYAFEEVIDNNKQSVRNLNQNIKLPIQNRAKPQKKQQYNQNNYEHIQLETQDKNHKLCKKQPSSHNLHSIKKTNNYFSQQENKTYDDQKIFYVESYDIENYIHDQRHIK
ncbi:hypothetical protein ABPG72_004136 [Tetrahymena utriculariae]